MCGRPGYEVNELRLEYGETGVFCELASHENNNKWLIKRNNAAGEATEERLILGRLIFSRISHGCYRREERQAVLLENHIHIA